MVNFLGFLWESVAYPVLITTATPLTPRIFAVTNLNICRDILVFDSKIEYISNTSKKPILKWNIFVIILRIILASNKALKIIYFHFSCDFL